MTSTDRALRIGTRGSALALRQSEWVAGELRRLHPDLGVELLIIKTRGDQIIDRPLTEVGGKGLFVKEIESALLSRHVDLAVHSLKDVPTETPSGLALAAFPPREDPRDVLVCREAAGLAALLPGARVATSSLRRMAQLRHARPDLAFVPLRGNVDTRLRKLREGQADAVVLAGAGLIRLGLTSLITEWLTPAVCVPAAGQGILCLETRADDVTTRALLAPLDSPASRACAAAERQVVAALQGGCEIPLGVLAEVRDFALHLVAALGDVRGERLIWAEAEGPLDHPAVAAEVLAGRLRELGAEQIVARCQNPGLSTPE
jgi:hydroxymethylbilane synthase